VCVQAGRLQLRIYQVLQTKQHGAALRILARCFDRFKISALKGMLLSWHFVARAWQNMLGTVLINARLQAAAISLMYHTVQLGVRVAVRSCLQSWSERSRQEHGLASCQHHRANLEVLDEEIVGLKLQLLREREKVLIGQQCQALRQLSRVGRQLTRGHLWRSCVTWQHNSSTAGASEQMAKWLMWHLKFTAVVLLRKTEIPMLHIAKTQRHLTECLHNWSLQFHDSTKTNPKRIPLFAPIPVSSGSERLVCSVNRARNTQLPNEGSVSNVWLD